MKLYESYDWLKKRYVIEKKTIKEMALEANCSHMTIQRYLEKYSMIKNQRKWTK
jgi:response regulator of citrate/malate metabolism